MPPAILAFLLSLFVACGGSDAPNVTTGTPHQPTADPTPVAAEPTVSEPTVPERATAVARGMVESFLAGDVDAMMEHLGLPFSWDGKKLVADAADLRERVEGMVKKSTDKIEAVTMLSHSEAQTDRYLGPDKDHIIVVSVTVKNEGIFFFIRRSDFKIVGFVD